jgi:hypothetical protein
MNPMAFVQDIVARVQWAMALTAFAGLVIAYVRSRELFR